MEQVVHNGKPPVEYWLLLKNETGSLWYFEQLRGRNEITGHWLRRKATKILQVREMRALDPRGLSHILDI